MNIKKIVRSMFLLGLLFGLGGAAAHAQFSVGIRIGAPPPPRVVRVRPVSPGADYAWVDGYWYPVGRKYVWHQGYWTRPPYDGAHWIAPHHDGHQFFEGYWDGPHGHMEHDHRWDRGHDRDWHHDDHHDDHR